MPRPCGWDGVAEPCDIQHGICDWRRGAMIDGTFYWDFHLNGWVLRDAPLRRSSFHARYYHEREAGLHDGEPVLWTCCPSCGGSMEPLRAPSMCDEDDRG